MYFPMSTRLTWFGQLGHAVSDFIPFNFWFGQLRHAVSDFIAFKFWFGQLRHLFFFSCALLHDFFISLRNPIFNQKYVDFSGGEALIA